MAQWTIYSKDGSPKAMTDGIFVGQRVMPELEYSGTWMGESFVTVTVKSPNPVDWQIGDYLIYREEKFVLNYDPTVVKKARRDTHGEGFIYESVKFNALQVEMGDVEFLDEVLSDNHIHYTSLPTFSFFAATVDDMADRIQANMNRYCEQNGIDVEYRWIILTTSLTRTRTRARASFTTQADKDTFEAEAIRRWNLYYNGEETNEEGKINQNVSISKTTVWGSLVQIYNMFGLHYITSGRTLVIGAAGQIAEHIFEYGKGNGLYEIERVADSEQQIITKLYAYGNNTNLPIRYYANINKQCFATIQQMQCHGHPTYGSVIDYLILDIQYSNAYFIGEQYAASEVEERRVVIRKGNDEYVGYAWGLHPFEPCPISFVHHSPPLPQSTFSEGDIIYFEEGINKDNWPSGFYSYINDSTILPDNLAVNHLMLPGFPIQSLKAWALENGGVENENGSITWKGYTAFLSDEPLAPYILSPNYTTLGVREASKTWDGSDDTEDIYPTIENTGDDIVVYAETIQDNGVFAEEDEIPNFHIIIPSLGEDVALDGLMSKGSASISMKTGYCGGRDFEVVNAVKVTTGWNLTLHRKLDESLQLYFPYSENAAKASTPEADAPYQIRGANIAGYEGDKFVILGIDMPPAYINASAEKLLEEALKFLAANDYARYTYTPRVDEIYMARQHDSAIASIGTENVIKSLHDTLHEGDLMRFADTDLEIDGTIFIEQLRIKEYGNANIPTYEVTLRNEKTVGTIERLQQTVDSLTGNGGNGTVIGGGVSVAQTKSLVRQEGDRRYIRKDIHDKSEGGMDFGNFAQGASGASIWKDSDGNWHYEGDFIHARKKFTAKEVQIEDVSHIGGQQLSTAASMTADFVVERDDCYRCFSLKKDDRDRIVYNKWKVGDQAYCCTFNLEQKGEGELGNHFYWRLVTGTSNELVDDGLYMVDGEEVSASDYHFIDLSKSDFAEESDVPVAGDDIVQLGYRNDDDPDRQNAIISAGAGNGSPYIRQFVGINSYTLPSPDTQIKPNDNLFTGRVKMQAGSEIDPSVVQVGATNLLLNTGFRGQHNSRNLDANTQTSEGLEMWSPSLEGWTTVNAEAIEDADSASGKACVINNGTLSQNLVKPMLANADYFLTLKGKGESITIQIGEQEETISLTNDYFVHHVALRPDANISELSISGTATICELFLEKSNIYSTTWSPSPLDADEALDKFNSIKYLTDAMKNASTTVLGGLILSNLIELGNYLNGEMQEVTAGVSGIYNNDKDVAFWAGGTLAQAITTVIKFKTNPTYKPTDEEWNNLAHAVITHGGDAVIKGTIFADNGYFRGDVYAENGEFHGRIEAEEGYMENVSLTGSLNLGSQWNYRMFPRSNNALSALTYVTDIGGEEHRVLEYGMQYIDNQYEPYLTIGNWDDELTDRSQLELTNESIVAINGTGSAHGEVHSTGFSFVRNVVGTMGTTASCKLVFEEQKDANNNVVGYEPHLYVKNSDEANERRIF